MSPATAPVDRQGAAAGGHPRWVIKDEPRTRIEAVAHPLHPVLIKRYTVPSWLRPRTLLRRARARREFRNLRYAFHRGVPCPRPLAWSADRGVGRSVRSSTLIMEYVEDSLSLRDLLRSLVPAVAADRHQRLESILLFGRTLGRLHRAGIIHGRPSTKDFLVVRKPPPLRVLVCDMPNSAIHRCDLTGSRRGDLDLFHALFKPSRRAEMSRPERLRALLAYTGGDRVLAWKLWRRFNHAALRGYTRAWVWVQQKLLLPCHPVATAFRSHLPHRQSSCAIRGEGRILP